MSQAPGAAARLMKVMEDARAKIAQYGRLGVAVYAVVAVITTGTAFVLIQAGLGQYIPWLTESPVGPWATVSVAWYAAKIPRMALTVLLVPIVARWMGREPRPAVDASQPAAPGHPSANCAPSEPAP